MNTLLKTFALVLVVALVFGMFWVMWLLWSWVLPQIYPSGPTNFITPSYWLFVGAWTLFSTIIKLVRGKK